LGNYIGLDVARKWHPATRLPKAVFIVAPKVRRSSETLHRRCPRKMLASRQLSRRWLTTSCDARAGSFGPKPVMAQLQHWVGDETHRCRRGMSSGTLTFHRNRTASEAIPRRAVSQLPIGMRPSRMQAPRIVLIASGIGAFRSLNEAVHPTCTFR
jgi:hypothetical protein